MATTTRYSEAIHAPRPPPLRDAYFAILERVHREFPAAHITTGWLDSSQDKTIIKVNEHHMYTFFEGETRTGTDGVPWLEFTIYFYPLEEEE